MREFPESPVEVIDLNDVLPRRSPAWKLSLWAAALATYGIRAAKDRQTLDRFARRTPACFEAMRTRLSAALRGKTYRFTFQVQSMFDCSQDGTPHFVYTDHTHLTNLYYPAFDRTQLYSQRWIELERSIYHHASMNLTMSSHVSRSIVQHYGCDPRKVACVGVGSNISGPPAHELADSRYARREVLFVGMDWERKGGPLLVSAFERVLERVPDARLTIIGCNPSIRLRNCEMLGPLPLREIGDHFRRASVFCMPTQREPFGIVFLEAFAHRLPIVATNIGAVPDIVHDGVSGYMIDPDDVSGLAERLVRLLTSPKLCKQFGEFGYSQMEGRYTWDATGKRIGQAIRRSLAGLDASPTIR